MKAKQNISLKELAKIGHKTQKAKTQKHKNGFKLTKNFQIQTQHNS
jgi:hypothetical protein